jgi:hypothetical protein
MAQKAPTQIDRVQLSHEFFEFAIGAPSGSEFNGLGFVIRKNSQVRTENYPFDPRTQAYLFKFNNSYCLRTDGDSLSCSPSLGAFLLINA